MTFRPFGGPVEMPEYLGRYSHKTAINGHRIKDITDTTIPFMYKDYTDGKKQKLISLSHKKFTRRFEHHILPNCFVKYGMGLPDTYGKNKRIATIHLQLILPRPMPKLIIRLGLQMLQRTGVNYICWPKCKKGKLLIVASYLNYNGT